jgi:hemerythrin
MTIRWIDAYKIGHEQIDAEHQELFKLVNQFLLANDKGSLTLSAMGMFKYTREHFTHEEDLMHDLGYPSIRDHVGQHNDLLSRLNGIAENIANDTLNKPDLESFLSHWLLNHIGSADAELAGYIRLQAT